MVCVFKPMIMMKSASDDESYYNKLPAYYLGVRPTPAISNPEDKPSEPEEQEDAGNSSPRVYDKIPSYFTELRDSSNFKPVENVMEEEKFEKSTVSKPKAKFKLKPMEERRVIYVGNVSQNTTLQDLRSRFSKFGPIEEVKLHFREVSDSYGFVTFFNKENAIAALKYGNQDPNLPKFDLCFGGRRHFCQSQYTDFDALEEKPATNKQNVS